MASLHFAVIAISSILLISTVMAQQVYGQVSIDVADSGGSRSTAIPAWVKTQFEWFVKGQIDEPTLLTSMNWMFDNNLMHLSEEAAQEVNDLREVNKRLHYGISSYIQSGAIDESEFEKLTGVDVEPVPAALAIPNLLDARKSGNESSESSGDFVSIKTGEINGLTTEVALQHLRKAYDLNPNDITVIAEYDPDHDKWISVRGFEWHTESTPQGDILSPSAIQKETFVFSHLLESSAASSSGESLNTTRSTITFTGLEFASATVNDVLEKGGTTSAWQQGIAAFSANGMSDSVVDELQGIVVLCSIEIDKQSQRIDAELDMTEQWLKITESQVEQSSTDTLATGDTSSQFQYNQSDLDFIQTKLSSIDRQIMALSNGVEVLSQKVQAIDDSDSTGSSADMTLKGKKILQNLVEKQTQNLEELSKRSKMLHDTAMNVIRKIG